MSRKGQHSRCLEKRMQSLIAKGKNPNRYYIEFHPEEKMCMTCGAMHKYPKTKGKFIGHVKIFGDIYDAVELTEPVVCPGCFTPTRFSFIPCVIGNTIADKLFEEILQS